jgi:hypothetical protein
MSESNIKFIVQNGEETIELTGESKNEALADRKKIHDDFLAELEAQKAKSELRESALAKLAALGLTEAEIAAL